MLQIYEDEIGFGSSYKWGDVLIKLLPVTLTEELPRPESMSDREYVMLSALEFSRIRLEVLFF